MADRDWTLSLNFCVIGFCISAEKVSEKLGIVPSASWKKGEFRREGAAPTKTSFWQTNVETESDDDMLDAANILMNRLRTKLPSDIEDVLEQFEKDKVVFKFVSYMYKDTPAIHLNNKNIFYLHRTGAELDISLWNCFEES